MVGTISLEPALKVRRCLRLPSLIAAQISQDITGRICDRLTQHFGRDTVFRDIDNIRPGVDFRVQIAAALQTTNVLLVVVGPKWFGRAKGAGNRINNEADPVRIELETALRRDIPVIPVLVGSTKMPTAAQLPEKMKDFAFRHAVTVDSGRDFDHHLNGLIEVLDGILGTKPNLSEKGFGTVDGLGNVPQPPPGRELSPVSEIVQTSSAPEPVAFASNSAPPAAWRQRYRLIVVGLLILVSAISLVAWQLNSWAPNKGGVIAARSQTAFDKAKALGTLPAWDEFLSKVASGDYGGGPLADQARQERSKLDLAARTQTAFEKAKALGTLPVWDEFLSKVASGDYGGGPLADQARQERSKLDLAARTQTAFDKAKALGTLPAWDEFLSKVASGDYGRWPSC